MKKIKKVMALVIAMAMVLGMLSLSAFAADGDPTGSITVKPSSTVTLEGKTLKAYKIMDATYSPATAELEDGAKQAISYKIPAALKDFYDEYFSTGTGANKKTASQLAAAAGKTLDTYIYEQMKDWGDNSARIKDFSVAALAAAKDAGITAITGAADSGNVKFSNLAAGYYVIEDEGTKVPISAIMLDTVTDADVQIELKASDKTEKVILTAGELVNQKANELGIGRDVEYKITQEIPDTTGYDYFYYLINDTLTEGLTFKPETLKVKVGGVELEEGEDYYLYADAEADAEVLNGKTFIVAFEDIVNYVNDEEKDYFTTGAAVEVTYSATVNNKAVVGVNPNKNTASVQFSNNPDKDQRGDKEDYPGIPKNTTDTPTGVGPNKITDTYSTQVTIYKEDGTTHEKLNGVSFTLSGTCKDVVLEAEEVFEEDPDGEFWKLNDGTYTQDPPTTEATVEELADGSAGGWVVVVEGEDLSQVEEGTLQYREVGGTQYRTYVAELDTNKTVYQIVEPNESAYDSTTIKYKKVVHDTSVEEYTLSKDATTAKVNNVDGVAVFSQLGAGHYTLTETGGLPGYNGIAPITFDLEVELPEYLNADGTLKQFTGNEKAKWSFKNVKNGTIEFDEQYGTFKITILNNKGTELPSTGGIGTTIFYIVGAVLVLGAGVVMITRRRMDAQ